MKHWKKVLVLVIITLFVVIGFIFVQSRENLTVDNNPVINNDDSDIKDTSRDDEKVELDKTTENVENEPVTETESKIEKETPIEEIKKPSISSNTNKKNETKPKEEIKKEDKPVISNPPTTEQTAWEKLGISEYDYYHAPAVKGQIVTHQTRNACVDEGNKKVLESDDIQFGCTEVISYSGDTLGYMLIIR